MTHRVLVNGLGEAVAAYSTTDEEIGRARALYAAGLIDADEYERRVAEALHEEQAG